MAYTGRGITCPKCGAYSITWDIYFKSYKCLVPSCGYVNRDCSPEILEDLEKVIGKEVISNILECNSNEVLDPRSRQLLVAKKTRTS